MISIRPGHLRSPSVDLHHNWTTDNNAPNSCAPKASVDTVQKARPRASLYRHTTLTQPIALRRPKYSMHSHIQERSGPREPGHACAKLHPTQPAVCPMILRAPSACHRRPVTTCSRQQSPCDPPGWLHTSPSPDPTLSMWCHLMRRGPNEHRRQQSTNHSS